MDDVIYRKDAAKILCNWCGVCSEDERDIMNCDDICPEFARIPSAQQRPFCYLDSPCPYQNEEIKVTQNDELSIAKNLVSNYSPQVLDIALKYAIHLVAYGIDIAEKHETVVQQEEMCSRAYTKGRYDEREAKRCIDCEAFNKSQLLVPQNEHMKWIPCSERLPDEELHVLACQEETGFIEIGCLHTEKLGEDTVVVCRCDDQNGVWFVQAWMPLPKPYKGESNGLQI